MWLEHNLNYVWFSLTNTEGISKYQLEIFYSGNILRVQLIQIISIGLKTHHCLVLDINRLKVSIEEDREGLNCAQWDFLSLWKLFYWHRLKKPMSNFCAIKGIGFPDYFLSTFFLLPCSTLQCHSSLLGFWGWAVGSMGVQACLSSPLTLMVMQTSCTACLRHPSFCSNAS